MWPSLQKIFLNLLVVSHFSYTEKARLELLVVHFPYAILVFIPCALFLVKLLLNTLFELSDTFTLSAFQDECVPWQLPEFPASNHLPQWLSGYQG